MKNLTLVIPAKNESESLPLVMEELKSYECKKLVILSKGDELTYNSIKNYECSIEYQTKSGYGNAIIEGINKVESEYLSIFYADGSTDPKDLNNMMQKLNNQNLDFVFGSRYIKDGSTEDDGIITSIGNAIFTFTCNLLFNFKTSDVLFTYIVGKTSSFKELKLTRNDFTLCIEIFLNAKKNNNKLSEVPCEERKRFGGKKKVNEIVDGFKILIYILFSFLKKS